MNNGQKPSAGMPPLRPTMGPGAPQGGGPMGSRINKQKPKNATKT